MKLIEIIRFKETKNAVFVVSSASGVSRWRIYDKGLAWEAVVLHWLPCTMRCDCIHEIYKPEYPDRSPGWWTRRKLNRWRAEFENERHASRAPLTKPVVKQARPFQVDH